MGVELASELEGAGEEAGVVKRRVGFCFCFENFLANVKGCFDLALICTRGA